MFGEISWGPNGQSPPNFRSFSNLSWSKIEHVKDTDGLMGMNFLEFTTDVTSHGVLSLTDVLP